MNEAKRAELMRKAIGARVRVERLKVELTQESLAERMGLPQSTISKVESGERNLRLDELFDYAEAMGMPPSGLFESLAGAVIEERRRHRKRKKRVR